MKTNKLSPRKPKHNRETRYAFKANTHGKLAMVVCE